MAPLQTAMASLTTASFTGACGTTSMPTAYDATHRCYNLAGNGAGKFGFGNSVYALPAGVYFFSGDLRVNGSATITGTGVTWVFLPDPPNFPSTSTLTINGNPLIQITAPTTVNTAQVPAALSSVVNYMGGLLIYYSSSVALNLSGSSTSYFSGTTYAPKADVAYQGSTVSNSCVQVIAAGVTLSGNSYFDNSGCPASTRTESHIVRMVQ
jgi:hypothetical protein